MPVYIPTANVYVVRMNDKSGVVLRWIATFKVIKAALMVLVAISILQVARHDTETALDHYVSMLGLDPGRLLVDRAIAKVVSIPPDRLRDIGFGSFVYAAIFLTEGIGLWLKKHWAEWFTVVVTGSLVPFEVYELVRHPTAGKVAALIINIAIVIYLVVHVKMSSKQNKSEAQGH